MQLIIVRTLQVIAALGLLNVWLLRFSKRTEYRGGSAGSMPEEFAAYGLPAWFAWVIGALKIGIALLLIAGLWIPAVVRPAALLLCVLMVGAIVMHFRINDPIRKYVPAALMLALAVGIVLLR